jgi:hypothetical protein
MSATPSTPLSPENTARQEYLQLVLKSLTQVKNGTTVLSLSFNKKEIQTIVTSLKPLVSQVESGISPEESTAIFKSRLDRLSKGDKTEWGIIRALIEVFALLITREELFELHELSQHFQGLKK